MVSRTSLFSRAHFNVRFLPIWNGYDTMSQVVMVYAANTTEVMSTSGYLDDNTSVIWCHGRNTDVGISGFSGWQCQCQLLWWQLLYSLDYWLNMLLAQRFWCHPLHVGDRLNIWAQTLLQLSTSLLGLEQSHQLWLCSHLVTSVAHFVSTLEGILVNSPYFRVCSQSPSIWEWPVMGELFMALWLCPSAVFGALRTWDYSQHQYRNCY